VRQKLFTPTATHTVYVAMHTNASTVGYLKFRPQPPEEHDQTALETASLDYTTDHTELLHRRISIQILRAHKLHSL